ncbi:short-chain dehydrogenase/reductase family protein [Sporothrix brasiliensis 5110]|uniref:Short-chain dehydrogenase/reductase family protein n=1 Tax=Sporothrix brasiliensis 5110 TaxID=1398154 RepID=A0A0C2IB34_9PEZI|nr:short-chain dehydrogenase/reductase family protein [Sporothrix brasiliensis 5110]KIH86461.1 short-chain dehydrogenase/reductase family protein [Sporothrix brasiliensis 5110]
MTSSVSLELPPRSIGFGRLFLDSQFMHYAKWPPKSTNLHGQTAIVTGASAGLGLEASRQLLDVGLSRLVVAVRSVDRGEAAAAALRTSFPRARIDVWHLEMESYTSVQAFAARVAAELPRVDVVLLNAGIVSDAFQRSAETGHERVVQVNYLSTFLLAILLLPTLTAKARTSGTGTPARLTIVNSGVALGSQHPWDATRPLLASFDDTARQPWNGVERYWSSKLLGQLLFIKLFPLVRTDDVVFNLVDPGLVRGTLLNRDTAQRGKAVALALWLVKAVTGRSLKAGGSTYVDAAVVKGQETHGCFIMDWQVRPFADFAYTAKGKENMEVLWQETLAEFKFAGVEDILASLQK